MIKKYSNFKTLYEKYNDNKLNELIVKYFNENSEEIIDIINSYENDNDVENIMQKISFIIESPGDVELLEKDGNQIAYFIDMKEVYTETIIYDFETKKFMIKSYKNYIDSKNE